MAEEATRALSVEEYLARERSGEVRHEYLEGQAFALVGASRRHNLAVVNVVTSLHAQLRDRDCEAYASDMRVRVAVTGLHTYPDVVVVCGEPRFDDTRLDTLLNPTLVVEVLSPSTEDYDRGSKFAHSRTLPSLAEYLVLAQDRVYAEHSLRQGDGSWVLTETTDRAAALELPSIGCSLLLAEVYRRILDRS